MAPARWFPHGFRLSNGAVLGRWVDGGEGWKIFHTDQDAKVLVATDALAQRWVETGLLPDTVFESFEFADNYYVFLLARRDQYLAPVYRCDPPASHDDALSFAISLRETRAIEPDVSLHDALFVERYSRLLPTWTVSPKEDDSLVLGTWLTGGVGISALSSRRILNLTGWLHPEQLKAVVAAAGLVESDSQVAVRSDGFSGATVDSGTAQRVVAQSTERPTIIDEPTVFRLPGRRELETFFNDHVIDILFHPERYRTLGIDFPTAIILHGPPGCGKTFAVQKLVDFLDWPVFFIDPNSVGSPYIHETSRKISELFDKAADSAPSAIVIDEMEAFLADRQQSAGLHHVEEVAEFLRRIPEAASKQVLVIGMTNRLDMIDPAILRRGRFDHVIEVSMPAAEEVTALLEFLLAKVPTDSALDMASATRLLTGRPLSDASFVIREAARLSARERKAVLDQHSFDSALQSLSAKLPEAAQRSIGFVWTD